MCKSKTCNLSIISIKFLLFECRQTSHEQKLIKFSWKYGNYRHGCVWYTCSLPNQIFSISLQMRKFEVFNQCSCHRSCWIAVIKANANVLLDISEYGVKLRGLGVEIYNEIK